MWATALLSTSILTYTLAAQETSVNFHAPQKTELNAPSPLPPIVSDDIQLVAQVVEQTATEGGSSLSPENLEAPAERPTQGPPAPQLNPATAAGTLSPAQQATYTPLSDIVSGGESVARNSTDVGDLLGKSLGALGVEIQRRTPIINDPHVRGFQGSQINSSADGAYFFPARPDLDTIVSRINSSLVENIIVLKGPYTVRLGPGFSFIDITTLGTPRYENGFEGHGSTSVTYNTNGQGWNGRQAFWGGGPDWGYRVGYDILTGGNYKTGAGVEEPSSYNMQNFDFAMGFDFTENLSMEFKYFRTMQRNVLFPGVITDLNSLVTDALSMRVILKEGDGFRSTLDGWYNHTSFDGDNLRQSKRAQLPFLDNLTDFNGNPTNLSLNLVTNGDNNSWGFRNATTIGKDKGFQVTAGWDFRYISQALNEFDTFFFANMPGEFTFNFPVPRSRQIDPGLFLDTSIPVGEKLSFKAGTRVDLISSGIQQPLSVPQPPVVNDNNAINDMTLLRDTDLGPNALDQRHFNLVSAFGTADYKWTDEITFLAGYGFAQRPPSLVELYGDGPFLALLQNGTTFVVGGNPLLNPEQLNQLDIGVKANYETLRAGANGYYSFIHDYITFENLPKTINGIGQTVPNFNGYRYINTPQARLSGFETYCEYDLTDWLTPFGTLTYVNGRDLYSHQALPGIYPLDSRAGIRIHDTNKTPRWTVELSARMVAGQQNAATSLEQVTSEGFTVFNIRSYWQVRDNLLLTAGIDNVGNRNYQEAFDLRDGVFGGVYQPGFNFYIGFRWTY